MARRGEGERREDTKGEKMGKERKVREDERRSKAVREWKYLVKAASFLSINATASERVNSTWKPSPTFTNILDVSGLGFNVNKYGGKGRGGEGRREWGRGRGEGRGGREERRGSSRTL
jgi:hypothetical protein